MKRFPAGRLGDAPSVGLSASLNAAGFKLGRLQTGTPARLDRNTIDFSNLPIQEGDPTPSPFSYLNDVVDNAVSFRQIDCLPKSSLNPMSRTTKFFVSRRKLPLKRTRSSKTTYILVFTFKRREKVHDFDILLCIVFNFFSQARGTVLHLSPRFYVLETRENTLSGLNQKDMTPVGIITISTYLSLTWKDRCDLPQWYLVQLTRRHSRTHDEDNPWPGKRENGQTSVWC